jgi:glycosyltransferase involved in cell wall biosynthesis
VVAWSAQYELLCGMFTPAMLADWYGACDVVMNIGNEGFGLPAVESQACGTPVILGDWSTGPELVGDGWLVSGGTMWNEKHRAQWRTADPDSVAGKLAEAYKELRGNGADARANARAFAMSHDIGKVVREHWEPVLADLG